MQSVRFAPSASSSCRYSGEAVAHPGDRYGQQTSALVDPSPSRVMVRCVTTSSSRRLDVRDEQAGRVRPEIDRCDAGHRTGRKTRSQRVRRCAAPIEPRTSSCAARRAAARLPPGAPGRTDRPPRAAARFVPSAPRIARARLRTRYPSLAVAPERHGSDDDDDQPDEREHQADQERGQDHEASLEPALQHPEHAADDLARERAAARRLQEVTDRVRTLAHRSPAPFWRSVGCVGVRRRRPRIEPRCQLLARALRVEPCPVLGVQRARCRSARHVVGRPHARQGGRMRVSTTGVGTPTRSRIVTAASPVPSWVRSSSRS